MCIDIDRYRLHGRDAKICFLAIFLSLVFLICRKLTKLHVNDKILFTHGYTRHAVTFLYYVGSIDTQSEKSNQINLQGEHSGRNPNEIDLKLWSSQRYNDEK